MKPIPENEIPVPDVPKWGVWEVDRPGWYGNLEVDDRMRAIWFAKLQTRYSDDVMIVALKTNPTGYNRFRVAQGVVETIEPEDPA